MKEKGLMCEISLLGNKGNRNKGEEKLCFMNFYNDRIEINCYFNKKGEYLVIFLGNKGNSLVHTSILSYTVKVENNSKQILTYPETYYGNELINIIEPLNGILKSGEKVKFKFESDLEKIFIKNGEETIYLEKNEEGFFEKEIIIKANSEGKLKIGQSKGFMLSSFYAYKVV